jgi:transcriptional regulator with GAF, ATPase, and Fis domain
MPGEDTTYPTTILQHDALLQKLLEATAEYTGKEFFNFLVKNLSEALQVRGAWVTEMIPEDHKMKAHALYVDGKWINHYEYVLENTPCETVIRNKQFVLIPENVLELFPGEAESEFFEYEAMSYMGSPILGEDGTPIGLLAVLHDQPLVKNELIEGIFKVFASRATAELRRLKLTEQLHFREQQLFSIINGAMDAIIEIDPSFKVSFCNVAAMELFACDIRETYEDFRKLLHPDSAGKLLHFFDLLQEMPADKQFFWLPENMMAKNCKGEVFHLEGTISQYASQQGRRYCLLIRNVEDKIKAVEKISRLKKETELLKDEIRILSSTNNTVIGESPMILDALKKVEQVAQTEATVLLFGETGTGKELFATAIHQASKRKNRTLVKVNCAAIPAQLMESEFFGHEKGAFTGANTQREGRFSLADGGTIFLDEIGELSYDLQSKLLRVLQEGEFEPIGSSKTKKVNVRVIAATNRNLMEQIGKGRFREDLYYRLNVFPINIPPLRQRGNDIILIAAMYANQFSSQQGKRLPDFDEESKTSLLNYPWPGNVRELRNVIERAVISYTGSGWNIRNALPEIFPAGPPVEGESSHNVTKLLNDRQLKEMEKENILKALTQTGWRVSGPNGAARLLNINPSTLASKMKTLGIARP